MDFGAYVICDCYQNGKTVKPPYEDYVKFDEDGLYLDLPEEIWRNSNSNSFQMENEFDEWKLSACKHEDMELIYANLSNNLGMAGFRAMIVNAGGHKIFPILSEYLPTLNGGIVPREFAPKMIEELNKLKVLEVYQKKVILYENSTNQTVASTNAESYQIFLLSKQYYFAVDIDGFFILEQIIENDKEVSYIVFRSKSFEQKKLGEKKFLFTDKKTNDYFQCSCNINPIDLETEGQLSFSTMEEDVQLTDNYKIMIEAFIELANASLETNNPIHWT